MRCRRGIFFWWPARLGSAWFVRRRATLRGQGVGGRRERKEEGRYPKAVFSRVGERRPRLLYHLTRYWAEGGVPIVHAAYDRMALAPSSISHGYSFLVFCDWGIWFFLIQNLNVAAVSRLHEELRFLCPQVGLKYIRKIRRISGGRNLLTLGQCDKESGLVTERLYFIF